MKVNKQNVPSDDPYKELVKDDMSLSEVSQLGNIVMKQKLDAFVEKWKRLFGGKNEEKP